MISPEILRRYPFFGQLSDDQLRAIAMITEETGFEKGVCLFEEGHSAQTLYLLVEGNLDLFYKSEEEFHGKTRKEFLVGEINPGEVFGISSMVEPYSYSASARAAQKGKYLKIDAGALRKLIDGDPKLAYRLLSQLLKVYSERLYYTRVQLAAERAE